MKKSKGFTLAELLIVVAIIAVLVAISIPIFTTQLEKSRESVDAANIRAAYAEVMNDALINADKPASQEVALKQIQDGWQNTEIKDIGGVDVSSLAVTKGGTVVVSYDPTKTGDAQISIAMK